MRDLDAMALAVDCARTADREHGSAITVIEVGDVLGITEFFVLVSASNRRLVRTLAERIEESAKAHLERAPRRIEGINEQQWVLMDYGDVIVHVFLQEIRDFYDIERLYRDVPTIDWRDEAV